VKNKQYYPVKIQGMMVVCDKAKKQTDIYLDCLDSNDRIINYFDPVFTCKHRKDLTSNKKVSYVRNHELFECDSTDLFGYFDMPDNYNNWIKDGVDFYDVKTQRTLDHLSSYYTENKGTLLEPQILILGDDTGQDLFYEINKDVILSDTNDYIYSPEDGTLSATLKSTATAKEYSIGKDKKSITLQCLARIMNPSLKMHKDIIIVGGHRPWPRGIYKKMSSDDKIVWKKVDGSISDEVEQIVRTDQAELNLNYGLIVNSWADKRVTAQEGKNWCDAGQQTLHHFDAQIDHCDNDMIQKFPRWSKLLKLKASNLHLDDEDITIPIVLKAISSLKQLKSLDFSHNSPIVDFNENYTQMANRSTETFNALGACLYELKNLKSLSVQGMWLRPHTLLNEGVQSSSISKEVAILTGIMNHTGSDNYGYDSAKNKKAGLRLVIDSISRLPVLENISIDAVPVYGSSFTARSNSYISYLRVLQFPARAIDGVNQELHIRRCSQDLAEKMVSMPSLEQANFYSPGGNAVDYFSKELVDYAIAAPRVKDVKYLRIDRSVLG